MKFVPAKELLQKAEREKYAVGAFNLNNLEWTEYILRACEDKKAPAIVEVSEAQIEYMCGFATVVNMVKNVADHIGVSVPIALHLDHGSSEGAKKAINAGFSSVMFDGSKLSFEDNMEKTRELVRLCKEKGVSIEAEVGSIGGEEDGVIAAGECADPKECKRIADLGIDFLAAGIGNIHGVYPENWKGLRFDVLESIKAQTKELPLVLHGGSGIPDDQIKEAIRHGICKINVNTECCMAFSEKIKAYYLNGEDQKPKGYDPRIVLKPGMQAVYDKVCEKIALFGSAGKGK